LFLIFSLFAIAKFDTVKQEESVYVLEDSNAANFISQNNIVFVKFYAPWCGHCKQMAPAFSDLGKKYNVDGSLVKIAKLDATVQKEFAGQHRIQGFPTIKLFIGGNPVDYQGERTVEAMTSFIEKKSNFQVNFINQPSEVEAFSSKKLALLFVVPQEDKENIKVFTSICANFETVDCAFTDSKKNTNIELNGDLGLIVFRSFDDGTKALDLTEGVSSDAVKQFIEAHRYPIVSEFDQEAANRIFGEQKQTLFFFDDNFESDQSRAFKEFAKENINNAEGLIFCISKISEGFGQRLADYVGVKTGPTARYVKFNNGGLDKFIVNDFSKQGLVQSLQDFKDNKLQIHHKSAPVPATNNEPVKVVVGETFQSLVLTADKFVLLEAYAPWCGHCKKLEPVYVELAEKVKSNPDIVIAKMDATENEHPMMAVTGFPTIRLFKPNDPTPVDYQGDRSLNDLIQFIE
jgi:protein disulfide-isomerase A1